MNQKHKKGRPANLRIYLNGDLLNPTLRRDDRRRGGIHRLHAIIHPTHPQKTHQKPPNLLQFKPKHHKSSQKTIQNPLKTHQNHTKTSSKSQSQPKPKPIPNESSNFGQLFGVNFFQRRDIALQAMKVKHGVTRT